jgi:DnaK suppressor protein
VAADHFMHAEDSRAQVASARDLEFAIGEHETATLAELDSALLRLDAGTYGACMDCATAIPEARLKALPAAPRCLDCQEKTEHLRR